jgi:hypothetical protein
LNATSLFIGVITGAIGTGYFIYGKKQGKYVAMVSGITLCVAPYFFDGVWMLTLFCAALLALPFIFKT